MALWRFVPIGIEHIVLGPDHIAFLLALLLPVGDGGAGGGRDRVVNCGGGRGESAGEGHAGRGNPRDVCGGILAGS